MKLCLVSKTLLQAGDRMQKQHLVEKKNQLTIPKEKIQQPEWRAINSDDARQFFLLQDQDLRHDGTVKLRGQKICSVTA